MKFTMFFFLFIFIFSFTSLFSSENPDVTNYTMDKDVTNFSFNLPDNFENNIDLFKSNKTNSIDSDFLKMIGCRVMGGFGIGLTVPTGFLTLFGLYCVTTGGNTLAFILTFVSLGALLFITIPMIVIGFVMAKYYKNRSSFYNMNKINNEKCINNPEFAFSIPL